MSVLALLWQQQRSRSILPRPNTLTLPCILHDKLSDLFSSFSVELCSFFSLLSSLLMFFFVVFLHQVSPFITVCLTGLTCEHLINFLLSDRITPLIAHVMPECTALHLKAEGGEQFGVGVCFIDSNMKTRVSSAGGLTFALRHPSDMTTA